jgi:hypothetical protein
MEIYLAGETGSAGREAMVLEDGPPYRLISYFYVCEAGQDRHATMRAARTTHKEQVMSRDIKLFLDSGAYSAFTKGVTIDIKEYCDFIKANKKYLEVYANLDEIGDPEGTRDNQKAMERQGLRPMPCFHYGEDVKYLHEYMEQYDYIALGGMVPIATRDLQPWLDSIFGEHICGPDGMPKVRVHGFGMTSLRLMIRYPWFSVDSTSWLMSSRMGSIYVPRWKGGKYDYLEEAWKIFVSARSPNTTEAGAHFSTMPQAVQRVVMDYLDSKELPMGKSEFTTVPADYELGESERFMAKADGNARGLERIIEPGLANDYLLRDKANLIYFLDLQNALPEYPWAFKKPTTRKGFL